MNEQHTGFVYKPTKPGQWTHGSKRATARFGASSLLPGGHGWTNFIPEYESQNKNGIETYACTVFATLKAWITLATFLGYSFPKNCSERFSAIMASVTPPGANPHDVAESIRSWGVINESALPFDDSIHTLSDFYHPNPMDEGYIAEAKKVVQQYELGHEYLWNGFTPLNKPQTLKSALERGTVCVSVYAWKLGPDGLYYKDPTDKDEHWVFLTDYVDGQYWIVDDQYSPYVKKLRWEFDFQSAEIYFAQPNASGIAPNDRSYLSNLLRSLTEWLTRLSQNLKNMPTTPPVSQPDTTVPPPVVDMLTTFCTGIRDYEGLPPRAGNPKGDLNYQNNNPGNCRCSSVGYAPQYGNVKCVNNFSVFPTYDQGWSYLKNLVKERAGKHPSWTISDFFFNYAPSVDNNHPSSYAAFVAKRCGVPVTTTLGDLLL